MVIWGLVALSVVIWFIMKSFNVFPSKQYEYGQIQVDEQAVTAMLSANPVMDTANYSPKDNDNRLKTATACVKDKIFVRLAHFTNAKAKVNCETKLKDTMIGIAEGLQTAGIISDQRLEEEVSYIENMSKSSIFPEMLPHNFCALTK